MTEAIERALRDAGLDVVLEARRAGRDLAAFEPKLREADILVLGALADCVRREEVGDGVRIDVERAATDGAIVVHPRAIETAQRGITYLRDVAMARILAAKGARIVVDWTEIGLHLAEVALSFGASEVAGAIVNKRGLPIAEDQTKKVKGEGMVSVAALKKKELAEIIRRTGRSPVFAEEVTA